MQPEVLYTRNFVTDATTLILAAADVAYAARGRFRLSLCGGSTPREVYAALAQANDRFDWPNTLLTFGDERTVGPDDDQSNYKMVRKAWLESAGVPATSVLRMQGELPPAEAAQEYADQLAAQAARDGDGIFTHDLILLGVGNDGHTASLFPGTEALHEIRSLVVANEVPQLQTTRITMTYPLINAARQVCFLVNSPEKQNLIDEILAGESPYPSARVLPAHGRLTWLIAN